ncbi:MAG: (Fe-S)-binding protein [Deltaproteobacteria bacterium]|nr:(Fe-S)-binding protein [Deltaproteobacteria bacterium]
MTIQEIAILIESIEKEFAECVRCGMCQSVCPLYNQTRLETDVARGKLAIIEGLRKQLFDNPAISANYMQRCLLCGSCAENCPAGVNTNEIFIKVKAVLNGCRQLPAWKKILLRKILAKPKVFNLLLSAAEKFQKIIIKNIKESPEIFKVRAGIPFFKKRSFKKLAPQPFSKIVPYLNTGKKNNGLKAAFFTGCIIDRFFPNVALSVIEVLKYHNIGIYIPKNQGCCGIPAAAAGDAEAFKKLLRYNINIFAKENFDYLITACATCTSTIKKVWKILSPDDLKEAVEDISVKTIDIHQFLTEKVKVDIKPVKTKKNLPKIIYHDPCHLKKSFGIYKEPRKLIKANSDYSFTEMESPDSCCGMGGSFNLSFYDISSDIGKIKRDNIVASGASVAATACPACMLQLIDMFSKNKDNIKVKHSIEIYAEALKNGAVE